MKRFDEVELLSAEAGLETASRVAEPSPENTLRLAGRLKRSLAFLTDVSLFVALALAMSPLLNGRLDWASTLEREWPSILSLSGFLLLLSYFYFAGCWLLWGKTVGGAIFDVRIRSESGGALDVALASRRWIATILSAAAAGAGFLPALLPTRRSVPDRVSDTVCVEG